MKIIEKIKDFFGKMKNKTKKSVNLEENGQVIKRNITCPACGHSVYYINNRTVACTKDNRTWDIAKLIKTIHKVHYNPEIIFAESEEN